MRRAFTLAEVLIVVVIVAILATLCASAATGGKARARVASCIPRQHQIVASLMLYASENDSRYPDRITAGGAPPVLLFCDADPYRDAGGWWTQFVMSVGDQPKGESSYGYIFGTYGHLERAEDRTDDAAPNYPAMTICVLHQRHAGLFGAQGDSVALGLDGTVVRGMRDGSVQVKRVVTSDFSTWGAFGRW